MLSRLNSVPSSWWTCKFRNISSSSCRVTLRETVVSIKPCPLMFVHYRWKSNNNEEDSTLIKSKSNEGAQLSVAEKVKQTTKDAGYLGVIITGVGVTGLLFFAILRELFSRQSPNSIYSDALKICRSDPSILDALGEPIKGYGELSSRGRRRHVSHLEYEKDGKNYMRMKFYVEGCRKSGTVHLEMVEGDNSKYEYRYLFVDIDGYSPRTIILKDNRHFDKNSPESFNLT